MVKKKDNPTISLIIDAAIVATITFIANLGLFVTFKDMYVYAAPKESVEKMADQLDRIEAKVNELCIKQHIKVNNEE